MPKLLLSWIILSTHQKDRDKHFKQHDWAMLEIRSVSHMPEIGSSSTHLLCTLDFGQKRVQLHRLCKQCTTYCLVMIWCLCYSWEMSSTQLQKRKTMVPAYYLWF